MTAFFFGNFLWALSKPFSWAQRAFVLRESCALPSKCSTVPFNPSFCCRAEWRLKRIHSKPSLHQPPVATEFSELWLNAFWCYPSGIMNNCLLDRTDVILFTSTCTSEASTVIIFYFLVCRFWLDGWACNFWHHWHVGVPEEDLVPEVVLFCPHFPTHPPAGIQLWDGTAPHVSFAGGVLPLSRTERGEVQISCCLSSLFISRKTTYS